MNIVDFIEKIKKIGITFLIKEGNLIINAPKGLMTKELMEEFKQYKEEIIQLFSEKEASRITKVAPQQGYPVSFDQKRIWLLSQSEAGNKAYVIPVTLSIKGHLDLQCFQKAFDFAIQRHEILRTIFETNNQNELRQVVLPIEKVDFKIDYSDFSQQENAQELCKETLQTALEIPFDFGKLLLRVQIIKINTNEYVLALLVHHIIIDGWSLGVLTNEVMHVYDTLVKKEVIDLPPLPIQYKDFADWQNRISQTPEWTQKEQYWLETFSGELPVLDLPTSRKRPLKKTYAGKNIKHHYSTEFTESLKNFSKNQKIAFFTTLMTGVNLLLYRYSNQQDIIVGLPTTTRTHSDLEGQVGVYLNTIAIRTRIDKGYSFLEMMKQVEDGLLGAYTNSAFPFDLWINQLNIKANPGRSILFDVMVVFQDTVGTKENTQASSVLKIEPWDELDRNSSKFDLLIEFFDLDQSLVMSVDYNSDIYDQAFIDRFILHFENLFKAIIKNPQANIDALKYISGEEEQQLLYGFNDTEVPYPKDKTVVDLFVAQVKKTPDALAVVFEDQHFTYQEIENRSNQFAHFLLRNYSIASEELIGVLQEKSPWIIPVLLGILKTGGAYVPIDLNYPEERINYLKEITDCKIVVDDALLQRFLKEQASLPEHLPTVVIKPQHLLHVMFTSGTTGQPKGVMLEHGHILRLITDQSYLNFNEQTTLLSTVSISFDTTNMEFWAVLTNGGKLVLATRSDLLDYPLFKNILATHQVNTLWLTASWFQHVVDTDPDLFKGLTQFITGGDIVSPRHTNLLLQRYPDLKIVNGYGPTENTTFSTTFLVDRTYKNALPIGCPLANSQTYVLNDQLLPQPVGVVGTLYVGGDGIARGYHKNEALTAERFMANPFIENGRIYDTGDWARWLPDGNLEFLGRKDHLQKIRGKFIDTTEIENTLCKIPSITQAVAVVDTSKAEKRIVAYVVSNEKIDSLYLKEQLKKVLSGFMIPQLFIQLPNIPLSHNGKVDRRALPSPDSVVLETTAKQPLVATQTPTEAALTKIWQEILQLDQISKEDDFFELGGYSLTSVTLISKIRGTFGKVISMGDLFENSVLSDLSSYLDEIEASPELKKIAVVEAPFYPLTFSQKRMWIKNQLSPEELTYAFASFYKIEGNYTPQKIELAFRRIVERHQILRSVFPFEEGMPVQKILPLTDAFKQIFDLIHWTENTVFSPADYYAEQSKRPFDLSENPPIRLKLVVTSDREAFLLMQMHHIAYDAWSIKILSEEFRHFMESEEDLVPLEIQFKDYAHWLNNAYEQGLFADHLSYWETLLANLPKPPVNLQAKAQEHSKTISLELDTTVSTQVKTICRRINVEDSYLFLSVFAFAYRAVFSVDDFVCNFPFLGRSNIQTQNVIGLFYQILILRIRTQQTEQSLIDYTHSLQSQLLDSIDRIDYPFEELVDVIPGLKAHTNIVSFNVINNRFIDDENGRFEKEGFSISAVNLPAPEKKFRTDLTFDLFKSDTYTLDCTYNASKYSEEQLEDLLNGIHALMVDIESISGLALSQIDAKPILTKE